MSKETIKRIREMEPGEEGIIIELSHAPDAIAVSEIGDQIVRRSCGFFNLTKNEYCGVWHVGGKPTNIEGHCQHKVAVLELDDQDELIFNSSKGLFVPSGTLPTPAL